MCFNTMDDNFEIYYMEVLSFLDKSILPNKLRSEIEVELREFIHVMYYKEIADLTAAMVTSTFLTTFKKYLA